jgi:hypothetical protein
LEHVVRGFSRDLVDERALVADAGGVDAFVQRVGGFRVQRYGSFGVGLAGGDTQPGMSFGIGVEAVQFQALDLAAAGPDPARDEVRRPLVRVLQGADAVNDGGEFMLVEVSGYSLDLLGDVQVAEQRPVGDVVPAPRQRAAEEDVEHRDGLDLGRDADRFPGAVVPVVGLEPVHERFEVGAGELGEAGDLRMVPAEPGGEGPQPAQVVVAVAGSARRCDAVEVAGDDAFHRRRPRRQGVRLDGQGHHTGLLSDRAQVVQHDVGDVHRGAGGLVPDIGPALAVADGGTQPTDVRTVAEHADLVAQLPQVRRADGAPVRVASV